MTSEIQATDEAPTGLSIIDARVAEQVVLGYPSERGEPGPLILGRGAQVRSNTVIYQASLIGDRLSTGHNVIIREECEIGDDVSIWSNSVIDYGCRIGNGVKIHSNCYVAQFTTIEDGAFLAPGVSLANDLYPGSERSAAVMRGPIIRAGAQIGVNATILPYIEIGEGAMIGSGSVVTRSIPPGMVAIGNPAVCTKRVSDLRPIEDRVLEPETPHDDQSLDRAGRNGTVPSHAGQDH